MDFSLFPLPCPIHGFRFLTSRHVLQPRKCMPTFVCGMLWKNRLSWIWLFSVSHDGIFWRAGLCLVVSLEPLIPIVWGNKYNLLRAVGTTYWIIPRMNAFLKKFLFSTVWTRHEKEKEISLELACWPHLYLRQVRWTEYIPVRISVSSPCLFTSRWPWI